MNETDSEHEGDKSGAAAGPKRSANAGWLERTFGITSTTGKIGCMSPLLVPVLLIGYCSQRSSETSPPTAQGEAVQRAVDQAAVAPTSYQPSSTSPALSAKQTAMVCKAGVAIMMGRDPKTMTATPQAAGLTRIHYRRPDDNKLWKTDCRIDGNRFMWRGVDSFGDDGPGRWRDSPGDEVITYTIVGKTVVMNERYSDGSTTSETYRF